ELDLDFIDTEHGRPSGRMPPRRQRGGELAAINGVSSTITDEGVFARYPAFAEKYPAGALTLAGSVPSGVFAVPKHGCLVQTAARKPCVAEEILKTLRLYKGNRPADIAHIKALRSA